MDDIVATAGALWVVYVGWLWFRRAVHMNRLDRRQLYEPSTGGPWVRPRGVYEDLPH